MHQSQSQRITITLPAVLVQQVDRLADYEFGSRSDVIRQAIVKMMREPQNELIANPDVVVTEKLYQYIKAEHPYLGADGTTYIRLLYNQKIQVEQGSDPNSGDTKV